MPVYTQFAELGLALTYYY